MSVSDGAAGFKLIDPRELSRLRLIESKARELALAWQEFSGGSHLVSLSARMPNQMDTLATELLKLLDGGSK